METAPILKFAKDLPIKAPEPMKIKAPEGASAFSDTLARAEKRNTSAANSSVPQRQAESDRGKNLPAKETNKEREPSRPVEKSADNSPSTDKPDNVKRHAKENDAAQRQASSGAEQQQKAQAASDSANEQSLQQKAVKPDVEHSDVSLKLDVVKLEIDKPVKLEAIESKIETTAIQQLKGDVQIKETEQSDIIDVDSLDELQLTEDLAPQVEQDVVEEEIVVAAVSAEIDASPNLDLMEQWVAMRPDNEVMKVTEGAATSNVTGKSDLIDAAGEVGETDMADIMADFAKESDELVTEESKSEKPAFDKELTMSSKSDVKVSAEKTVDPLNALASAGKLQNSASAASASSAQQLADINNVMTQAHSLSTATKIPEYQITTRVNSPQFATAVGQQIEVMIQQNQQNARLQLNPANLGPMNIAVQMRDEEVTVAFSVNNVGAKEAIESALPRLREMLEDAGFSTVNVDVSEQSSEQNTEFADNLNGQRGGQGADSSDAAEQDAPEPAAAQTIGLVDAYV